MDVSLRVVGREVELASIKRFLDDLSGGPTAVVHCRSRPARRSASPPAPAEESPAAPRPVPTG